MTAVAGRGLFEGLDEAARAEVGAQLRPRDLDAGEVLCHAGDRSDSLYVVERGLLHVLDGDTGALLGRQRRGDVVGEAALLTGEPRSATLVARVPSVVAELSREAFLAAGTHHPRLLANLATIVSRRLVARTAAPAARVTALVTPATGWAGSVAATAAAQTCSAAPLTVLDTALPLPQLLSEIDAAATAGPVLVHVSIDHEHLAELLGHCDHTVAVHPPRARSGRASAALPADVEHVDADTDPARLGRRLARASVGIALGAGGAKGWAHVGVLRSLQRAGYVVDAVAGSSIGAWVGAWTSLGHDADTVEELMREGFDEYAVHAVYRQGGPQGTAVMTRLARESTNDASFSDLDVPLAVLAADLVTQRPATIADGSVAQALVTAMTVPGLYPPVRRGHQRLVDAVVLTPVPTASVAGVNVTIAVNLLGSQEPPASTDEGEPQPANRDRDPVLESLELASRTAAEVQAAYADVPVTPRFGLGTWAGFEHADRYLAAGEEAMDAALPALAALAKPPRA